MYYKREREAHVHHKSLYYYQALLVCCWWYRSCSYCTYFFVVLLYALLLLLVEYASAHTRTSMYRSMQHIVVPHTILHHLYMSAHNGVEQPVVLLFSAARALAAAARRVLCL